MLETRLRRGGREDGVRRKVEGGPDEVPAAAVRLLPVTAWAAITINFLIPRLLPGDPVKALHRREPGPDQPGGGGVAVRAVRPRTPSAREQYLDYWPAPPRRPRHVVRLLPDAGLRGDRRTAWTIGLVGIATIVSFTLGTGARGPGRLAARHLGRRPAPITTFFSSVPYFWLGLIAICCSPYLAAGSRPPAGTAGLCRVRWSSSESRSTTECCPR